MPIGTNKILSQAGGGAGGGSRATREVVYDEGNDCRPYLSNWNRSENSQMYARPIYSDYGYWHGWGGSARTYTLNKGGLPSHQYLCYDCIIHDVDSRDNEYQYLSIIHIS